MEVNKSEHVIYVWLDLYVIFVLGLTLVEFLCKLAEFPMNTANRRRLTENLSPRFSVKSAILSRLVIYTLIFEEPLKK